MHLLISCSVTRLLKASKSIPKPSNNRESFSFPSTPDSSSTLSFKSNEDPSTTYASTSFFASLAPGSTSANKKMQAAQAELQACEAHLAKKELELETKRSSAIRDGLRVRFRALGQCGWHWTEVGKEVEVVLGLQLGDQVRSSSPAVSNKPLPVLHSPVPVHAKPPATEFDRPSSDLSSIAPSQSASQIGVVIGSPPPISPVAHIYSNLEAASRPSPSSTPTNSSQAHGDLTSFHLPPAHSIDDLTMPTADTAASAVIPDTDATITRRHVLPRRITEEDLASQPRPEAGESSDDDSEGDHLPSDTRVVENPRFSPQKPKTSSHSSSSLSKAGGKSKGRNMTMSTSSSFASGSGSGFFGSLRGLFTRHGKTSSDRDREDHISDTSAMSPGTLTDDNSLDNFQQPRGGGKKTRVGLLGRNKKKGSGNIFSDDEDGNDSVMSSPAAFPRVSNMVYPSSLVDSGVNGPMSDLSTIPRSRTISDIHPSEKAINTGKKLKKSGPGVGPRGRTASSDIADSELKRRRRSASLDYGDLSVNGKTRRRRSRAEEWLDDQGQNGETQAQDDKPILQHDADEDREALTKKSSVKREKSPFKLSVSRNSSIKSAAGAPSGSVRRSGGAPGRVMSLHAASSPPSSTLARASSQIQSTQNHKARAGSIDSSSSSTFVSPSSSSSTLTPNNIASPSPSIQATAIPTSTTKNQRRASSPVSIGTAGSLTSGEGSVSLMSIVEDVAKANREAWSKQGTTGGSSTNLASTLTSKALVGKSIGGTVKPVGLLPLVEVVKAPKSIDLEGLREQMDKELQRSEVRAHTDHQAHSNLAASTSSEPTPVLAAVPVVTRVPASVQTPLKPGSGQVLLPLRSALKNPSRTPSPMLPPGSSSLHQLPARTASPVTKVPNGDYKDKDRANSTASPNQGVKASGSGSDSDSDSDLSDAASISSYETGHEVFAEEEEGAAEHTVEDSGEETETGEGSRAPTPPPHDKHSEYRSPLVSQVTLANGNAPQDQTSHAGGSGSDVSASTASTETPRTLTNTADTSSTPTTPPRRRKSVRVSLQPTFSVTPPAIEDDDEEDGSHWQRYTNDSRSSGEVDSQISGSDTDGSVGEHSQSRGQDMWVDSSDEDMEYQQAKKLLSRFSTTKKTKVGR
ncbi:hypothetical protein GYMLUDRAFT_719545 [Collybiopsis luxurians FD-317 M1]|nr:hypothetical protein GYMLUDRAFT_719545 [Collybiopsis luxurians FD-317 M1]